VPTGAALGSCPLESPAGCAVDQRNDLCDKELDPDSEDLYTGAILGHFFLGGLGSAVSSPCSGVWGGAHA